jgi:hypothetical protein
MDATSLRQRPRGVPAPVLDVGLAVALAVAVTIGIRVAPGPGAQPDAVAYACGLIIAALALARRRWPLVVLLASSATLQVYYLSNYTSTYPAVPLAIRDEVGGRVDPSGQPLQVRIGIDTGPVEAGVIGTSSSATTSGATPSTPPAAWNPMGSPAASR